MRNQRDEPQNATSFDATTFVEDYTFDCNTATTVGDALATYLRDLGTLGQLNSSVAA
jgi:hypothetical protein